MKIETKDIKERDKMSEENGTPGKKSENFSFNEASSLVHNTSGGEMPDPSRMPSTTDFHLELERNI